MDLFGDVQAVEVHHGRRAAALRPMGMDQNRRETLPVVGNLDRLQLRHGRLAGGIAKAIDPPFEAREALIGFGLREALANVIIVSRAKEVGSRAPRMRVARPWRSRCATIPSPFFVPGLVVAHAIVQAQALSANLPNRQARAWLALLRDRRQSFASCHGAGGSHRVASENRFRADVDLDPNGRQLAETERLFLRVPDQWEIDPLGESHDGQIWGLAAFNNRLDHPW